MILSARSWLGAVICTFCITGILHAAGFKGGGGGHSAGGGHTGGGPQMHAPSSGHMGGGSGRPNMGARPNPGSSAHGSIGQRPNFGGTRPTNPGAGANRPNLGNGLTVRPGTFPNKPPSNQIGGGGMKPSFPGNRPGSGNNLNPDRPTKLPGVVERPGYNGNRPDVGYRPPNRPSNPDMGFGRPGRPGSPDNKLPNNRPGSGRPSPGDVGDFLGIGHINRPGIGPNVPGTRPSYPPGGRPDFVNRPNRPGNTFPGQLPGYRPGVPNGNKRPINVGQINVNKNNYLYNRPSWANINNSQINSIHNKWNNQMVGLHGWANNYPGRVNYWNNWGSNVRHHWNWNSYRSWYGGNWYNGNWWYAHPGAVSNWHYYRRFNYYPWSYWWSYPSWSAFGSWFNWNAPATVWSQPVYYDYGAGGNVTYQNNYVYMNGQQVASTDDFAQSAAALATVAPPANDQQANDAEWMPLGTFAMSTGENDLEPSRTLQLAVNRDGIVAGTLYNTKTDQAQAIQGQVDSQTQRVAFRLSESENVVAETGLYNLTQDSAPLLVHFGTDRVENYNLVRLSPPDDEDQ